jgi:hypothetical protein
MVDRDVKVQAWEHTVPFIGMCCASRHSVAREEHSPSAFYVVQSNHQGDSFFQSHIVRHLMKLHKVERWCKETMTPKDAILQPTKSGIHGQICIEYQQVMLFKNHFLNFASFFLKINSQLLFL